MLASLLLHSWQFSSWISFVVRALASGKVSLFRHAFQEVCIFVCACACVYVHISCAGHSNETLCRWLRCADGLLCTSIFVYFRVCFSMRCVSLSVCWFRLQQEVEDHLTREGLKSPHVQPEFYNSAV